MPSETGDTVSSNQEAVISDGDCVYNSEYLEYVSLYDYGDITWMDAIKALLEQMEGFSVEHDELILKAYHWGTEIGVISHYGTCLGITPSLVNELAKYELNFETFMVANDINYQLIKPQAIKHPIIRPGLHYTITWTADYTGKISDGDLTCWFTYNQTENGNHIELIHKNSPCCSHWPDYLIRELQPWFDAIWVDIKTNHRKPRRFNLAQRIGSYLPLGFKAYADGFNKAEVQRTRKKYAYITQYGDRYIISKSPRPKDSDVSTESLVEAVSLLLKMINNQ